MRGHRDLRLTALVATVCAVLAVVTPVEAISLVFAAPLALFLPGYALTAAVFARRPIDWRRSSILSLGLSLVTLALGGLVLNYLPGGVRSTSWALLLLLVVLASCRATALRRPAQKAGAGGWSAPPLPSKASVGLLAGALLTTVAALALAFTTTSAKNADGFTELWLLPPTPRDASVGGARVGVTSQEQHPTAYALAVRVGDGRPEIVRDFSLDPGQTRVLKLSPSPASSGGPARVKAVLSRKSSPGSAYRRVSGWMFKPRGSR